MERHGFGGMRRRLVAATVAMVALVPVGTASAQPVGTTLAAFSTPGDFDWKVPNGVKRVSFELFGAQGGNATKVRTHPVGGGQGGRTIATFDVQAGQLFKIVVGGRGGDDGHAGDPGGGGAGRFGGAGGGGATSVVAGCVTVSNPPFPPATECKPPASRILVAGGGGGAIWPYTGGDGGEFSGGRGHATCINGSGQQYPCYGNGEGGYQYREGRGGFHFPYWVCRKAALTELHPWDVRVVQADSGSFGNGGGGGFDNTTDPLPPPAYCVLRVPGSGGGGGWFGGGGSLNGQLIGIDVYGHPISEEMKGSGGGGSSYISPLAISGSTQGGVQWGDGRAVIRIAQ